MQVGSSLLAGEPAEFVKVPLFTLFNILKEWQSHRLLEIQVFNSRPRELSVGLVASDSICCLQAQFLLDHLSHMLTFCQILPVPNRWGMLLFVLTTERSLN